MDRITFPIGGFREGWADRLEANCPKDPNARAGYLSALACLNAERLPHAFVRSHDVEMFQRAINYVRNGLINRMGVYT